MYIIKLKCLILADYFSQCFCWDNLHVTVISIEPIWLKRSSPGICADWKESSS